MPPKPEDESATSLFIDSDIPADRISSSVARQKPFGANTLGASMVSTTNASGGLDQAQPHSGQARKTFPFSRVFTNIAKPALAQTEQSPAEYMELELLTLHNVPALGRGRQSERRWYPFTEQAHESRSEGRRSSSRGVLRREHNHPGPPRRL